MELDVPEVRTLSLSKLYWKQSNESGDFSLPQIRCYIVPMFKSKKYNGLYDKEEYFGDYYFRLSLRFSKSSVKAMQVAIIKDQSVLCGRADIVLSCRCKTQRCRWKNSIGSTENERKFKLKTTEGHVWQGTYLESCESERRYTTIREQVAFLNE